MLGGLKLRLIDDYHKAWRFSSMRFMALGVSCQGAVVTSDRLGISQHVAPWVLSALSTSALACMVAAGLGRITTTEPRNEPLIQPDRDGR